MNPRRIISIGFLFFLTHGIHAQIYTGLKTSIISNDTKVHSGALNANDAIDPLTGFSFGGIAGYQTNSNFAIETGLHYRRLGFQTGIETDFNVGDFNIPIGLSARTTVNYLEMPFLIKYQHDFGSLQWYLKAGPALSYALNGQIQARANSFIDINLYRFDLGFSGDRFNRFAVNGHIAAGLQTNLSEQTFLYGEIGYAHDFSTQVEIPIVDGGVRNSSWSLGVGVGYRF